MDAAALKPAEPFEEPRELYFPSIALIDCMALPPPAWLVDGWIEKGSTALVYGAFSSGKSFFALDLALHVALDRAWHGKAVERAGVVYVCAEGRAGFGRRIKASVSNLGIDPHDLLRAPFRLVPASPNLADANDAAYLLADLTAQFGPEELGLVVLDTYAQLTPGVDENSRVDVGLFLQTAERIRDAFPQVAVLIVHHSGHDGSRARGSTALPAASEAVIRVENTGSERLATVQKHRDAADGEAFAFQLQPFDFGDGTRTSCIVVPIGDSTRPVQRRRVTGQSARALLILREGLTDSDLARRGANPELPAVPCLDRASWRSLCDKRSLCQSESSDARGKAFRRAVDDLLSAGAIGVFHDWFFDRETHRT